MVQDVRAGQPAGEERARHVQPARPREQLRLGVGDPRHLCPRGLRGQQRSHRGAGSPRRRSGRSAARSDGRTGCRRRRGSPGRSGSSASSVSSTHGPMPLTPTACTSAGCSASRRRVIATNSSHHTDPSISNMPGPGRWTACSATLEASTCPSRSTRTPLLLDVPMSTPMTRGAGHGRLSNAYARGRAGSHFMSRITDFDTADIRFPTSLSLDGSDAMNPDPDYSAAYVRIATDAGDGLAGHGFVFTIGRGNDVQVAAIEALRDRFVGRDVEELLADMGAVWRELVHDSQLRWLGPGEGRHAHGVGAVVNALWDLKAKRAGPAAVAAAGRDEPRGAGRPRRLPLPDRRADPRRGARDPAGRGARARGAARASCSRAGYPAYTTTPGWLGYDDAKLARLCREAVDDGFELIKLKVGARPRRRRPPAGDRPRRRRARTSGSPSTPTSAGTSPRPSTGSRALQPYDLAWIEEPTNPDDVLGHAAIARGVAPIPVATGEHMANRVMFKQFLQAEALQVLQIDATRVAGVNENVAILLLAAKFGVPVCPHAGGVGLCEAVQHLAMFDFVAVSGTMDGRVIEFVDHLHEHFVTPVEVRDGRYRAPTAPGRGTEMLAEYAVARAARPARATAAANVGNLYRAMTDEDARAVLEAAWDSGIRYFDTAPHYGLGLSERRLGAFLADQAARRVRRLDQGRPAAAAQPRDGGPARRREPVRRARVAASACGTSAPTASGASLEESLRAPRPRRRRRPLPARPRRARPGRRPRRPACPRWPRCATRGSSARSGSARSRPRRWSPRCAPGRSTSLMVAGRYTLLEQPARRAGAGVPRRRGRDRRGGGLQLRAAVHAAPRPGDRYEYGAVPPELLDARAAHRGRLRAARGGAAGGRAAVPAARAGGAERRGGRRDRRSRSARTRGGCEAEIPEALWDELRQANRRP